MISTDRAVRGEIDIAVRAMTVTHALTDVAQMKEWWGVEKGLVEERADGTWAVSWNVPDDGAGSVVLAGTIRSLRHSSHLHVQRMVYVRAGRDMLGPVSLTFEARERGTSTHLMVCQEGFGTSPDWEWYRNLALENWPRDLARLKGFLERPR